MDLADLLTAHPFPAGLEAVCRSFARQPDHQTCGASAIRHGLLLGGLGVPTAALEAVLDIRRHAGTPPGRLRDCLRRLGLEVRPLRKPARQSTGDFLESLTPQFAGGAFLLPCARKAEHWVCVGAWRDGRAAVIDSYFDRWRPAWHDLSPGLGFFRLLPEELDALDWAHHVMLVRPGRWRAQYAAWLPARAALLRLRAAPGRVSLPAALRQAAHQFLDDAEYNYRGLRLYLRGGASVALRTADPGADAVGVGVGEVITARRLGGGRPAAPELVLRAAALGAFALGA